MPRQPMIQRSYRVPADLYLAASTKADAQDDNISKIIREALQRYVKQRPKTALR